MPVPGEDLVAAVAGQRHGDVLPGEARDKQRRDLGGVGERLVVDVRQLRDDGARRARRYGELGMVRPEMPGDGRRRGRLVVPALLEADREGLHRPRTLCLHQRHYNGRIDAPREERTERHVRDQAPRNRVLKQPVEFLDHLRRGPGAPRPRTIASSGAGAPERLALDGLPETQETARSGLQLPRVAKDRVRGRHVPEPQVRRERCRIDLAPEALDGVERLELGREDPT